MWVSALRHMLNSAELRIRFFCYARVILFRLFTQPRSQAEELTLSITCLLIPRKPTSQQTCADFRSVAEPAVSNRSEQHSYAGCDASSASQRRSARAAAAGSASLRKRTENSASGKGGRPSVGDTSTTSSPIQRAVLGVIAMPPPRMESGRHCK